MASVAPCNSGANCGALPCFNPPFDPYLADPVILPVGEQADAVAAGEDLLQVMLQLIHREVFVNHLTDLKGRLYRQRNPGYHPDRTQVDRGPMEPFAIPLPGDRQRLPVRRDYFQAGDGRRQVAILIT